MKHLIFLFLLFSCSNVFGKCDYTVDGEDPFVITEGRRDGAALYVDQDFLGLDFIFAGNEDRDYTMGLQYTWFGTDPANKWSLFRLNNHLLKWSIKRFHFLPCDDYSSGRTIHASSIGNTAFTPDDLSLSIPEAGDRPYANLIYTSVAHRWVEESDRDIAITNNFIFGILGLDSGQNFQTFVHEELTDGVTPEGWDSQIGEGWEPTFLFNHNRSKQIFASDDNWRWPEISYSWEGNLGYYVNGAADILFRWGNVSSRWYEHTKNPLSSVNHFAAEKREFYLFLSGGVRAVAYNALLQGWIRDNEYEIAASNIEPLVGEVSFGFTKGFKKVKWTFAVNYRSSEIKQGAGDREHVFGGLYFHFNPKGVM